jgi:hypothetical protein
MGFVRDLTGKTAVDAAGNAADAQVLGGQEASALFDPFKAIGQQGLDQTGFLTDPEAQFDFLQNNPLFQSILEQNNQVTANAQDDLFKSAAARGRLSAGDTLQQTQRLGEQSANNLLLSAAPLIQNQKNSIGDLLNFGLTTASNQGNLRTGQAAAEAGGIVGSANARGESARGIVDLGAQIAGAFSDPQLKENIKFTGNFNGFNTYTWDWNDKALELGLSGSSAGVMADQVKVIMPQAINIHSSGYMMVDYDMIGVKH